MPAPAPPPSPPEPDARAVVRRLLALAWSYRIPCLAVLVLQLALLGLGVVGLSLTGLAIDELRHRLEPGIAPPRWPFGLAPPAAWTPLATVGALAAAVLGIALARVALSYLHAMTAARLVQQEIVSTLRTRVYDRLQRLSSRFVARNGSGTLINRVTGDVQSVRAFVDGVLIQGAIMVLSLAVYLAYMVRLHPGLTAACLATMPLLGFATTWFTRWVGPQYQRNRELSDRLALVLSESVQGAAVTKAFAREEAEIARFADANRALREQQRGIFRRISIYSPGIDLLGHVNLVVLLGYGGWLVMRGELPLGAGLVVFAGLLSQFSAQVSGFSGIANTVQQSLTAARRVFAILDAPVEVASPPDAYAPTRVAGAVRFAGVRFAHEGGEPALDGIELDVAPGTTVAILGATGAGKTTLLDLLPRFADPSAGAVLIDGVDARRWDLPTLRRAVGSVFQESFLFSTSVAANIAFGHPEASRAQVERAARIASADDFIRALPRGYDTVLGEAGVDLSGGQRQRLAIARAVLLDPPILVLDDPTAAIDARTEGEILAAIEGASAGRTTFIVAHRVSTLRRADLIVVLERGRIVERGTHADLLARDGHYRRVARLQLVDDDERERFAAERP